MSEKELIQWAAYLRLEPPLAIRMEIALAQLTALTANIHRDSKKREEPFEAKDFLPEWDKAPEPAPEAQEDGMAPEKMLRLIDGLMEQQERRKARERRRGKSGK